MKKLSLLLVFLMLFSAVGCVSQSGDGGEDSSSSEDVSSVDEITTEEVTTEEETTVVETSLEDTMDPVMLEFHRKLYSQECWYPGGKYVPDMLRDAQAPWLDDSGKTYQTLIEGRIWLGAWLSRVLEKAEQDQLLFVTLYLPSYFEFQGDVGVAEYDAVFEAELAEYESVFAQNGIKTYRDPSYCLANKRYVFAFMTKEQIYSLTVEEGKRLVAGFSLYHEYVSPELMDPEYRDLYMS